MSLQKIGVLGSGSVGTALAEGFLKHGYAVKRGTREAGKLAEWAKGAGPNASAGSFADAARFGDAVVLAVKGFAAESVLEQIGIDALAGKLVIDTTNPLKDEPPVDGVLSSFTRSDESLFERLQGKAPHARFVKCFSCVGSELMVNPVLAGGPPTMFICGNDPGARAEVTRILTQFGWETADLGVAAAARVIEPLAILWCVPGFLRDDWSHALKMLR